MQARHRRFVTVALVRNVAWALSSVHGILAVLLILLVPSLSQAQTRSLEEMSLEELLNLRLIATGVMGTHHTHPRGEWMVGYTQMHSQMTGIRIGTRASTDEEVLRDFKVSPTAMEMNMRMIGVMYAPKDDLTLMAMVPLVHMSMDHVTRRGMRFTTESAGLGDVVVTGLYSFYKRDSAQFHLDFGVGLPTGSIDERADTPAGAAQKLPYPMQLGSGVFSLKPGITYLGQYGLWNWGSHMAGSFGLGRNANNYSPGDLYVFDVWGTRAWNRLLSTSLRITGRLDGGIDGADPDLDPTLVPTANPAFRGGKSVDLRLGANLYVPIISSGNRFTIEVILPTYQSFDGPQLARDWGFSFGWHSAWGF